MEEANAPWRAGSHRHTAPRSSLALLPAFMGQELQGRPEERKSSFVIKIDRAEDGTHTVNVDFDLTVV